MRPSLICLTLLVAQLAGSGAIRAQALGGLYTCANGNTGGTFDYSDLGAFFNDLEDFGVNAPVVLELFDSGGPFVPKESYQLGFDGDSLNPLLRPVNGISAANTLTIRAAQGASPVIQGRGAGSVMTTSPNALGCMSFLNVGHTTVEGLEFTGGDFGIHWLSYNPPGGMHSIRVAKCRFHGLLQDAAIGIVAAAGPEINNITIENNAFWNCSGPGGGATTWGVISIYDNGTNCAIRNNTILHIDPAQQAYDAVHHRGDPLFEFAGNIIQISSAYPISSLNSNIYPTSVNHNVIHTGGVTTVSNLAPDWASWQAAGLDPNGMNVDPLLVSVTPGSEDLRLRPDSPAIDLIPFGGPALDVFGNPRPYGLGFDAGAHELQNFGARAGLAAGSVLVGPSGGPFSITLNHGDALADVVIELSDFEADDITVSSVTASAALAGVVAPAIPAPGQPLILAWTGFIDDTNPPGTYTWTVEFADAGTGFAMTCQVSITVTSPPPVALHTPSPLPPGRVGQPYSLALQATGTGTLVFSVLAGDLPPGLQLSTTGHITGTPTTDGDYNLTVQAADNFTKEQQDYEITIKPKPPTSTDSGSCSAGHTSHTAWLILIALATLAVRRATGSRQTAGRKH